MVQLLKDLIAAQHLLRLCHWNSSGKHFDSVHAVCGDYVDHIEDDIDAVAEMVISLGKQPVTLDECKNEFGINIDVNTTYQSEEIYAYIVTIFNKIIKDYTTAQAEQIPAAYRSELETMQHYYLIENMYKNMRRLTK